MNDAFIGEVRAVGFSWCPADWLPCNGQVLSVQQYQALFAILGNTYGGSGGVNFAVPNLNGTAVTGAGQGPGLQNRALGVSYGSEQVAVAQTSMPAHTHTACAALANDPAHPETATPGPAVYLGHLAGQGQLAYAPGTSTPAPLAAQALGPQGGSQPHENRQPYLTLNYIICYNGEFPPRP